MKTVGEKWKKRVAGHWYEYACDFAVRNLGAGEGRSCLVIGSPVFEVAELKALGWDVTYLDIRTPPFKCRTIVADATQMPVADKSFDAVSSTCVLCHVGTGRYGDRVVADGDITMLAEIARILRQGTSAALMLGPVGEMVCETHEHRIYTMQSAGAKLAAANLTVVKIGTFCAAGDDLNYLSMLAQKDVAPCYPKPA